MSEKDNNEPLENEEFEDDIDDVLTGGSVDPDTFEKIHTEDAKFDNGSIDTFLDERVDSPAEMRARSRKRPKREKRKKKFSDAPVLSPTPVQLQEVTNILTEFYNSNPVILKNLTVEQKIKEVIEECKKGWICAPRDFEMRVRWKSKCKKIGESLATKARLSSSTTYARAKEVQLRNELAESEKSLPPSEASLLRETLSEEERKFWIEREKVYKEEFEFNESSDRTLLNSVLIEELTHRRLIKRRMMDPYDDIEFALTENGKRLAAALNGLGVTRAQREKKQEELDGNIASISVLLDEKLAIIEKKKAKDRLEEQAMFEAHDNKTGFDTLPNDLRDIMSKAAAEEDTFEFAANEMVEEERKNSEQEDKKHGQE